MFESEWEQKSLFGWENAINRIYGETFTVGDQKEDENQNPNMFHCMACNKTFMNESVFHHHKKGKRHIKAINALSKHVSAPSLEQSDLLNGDSLTKRG